MFAQVHYPDQLPPELLDRYLEHGWFRMGQSVFTTNFLHFKQQFYSAIWLRISLDQYAGDSSQHKLFKKNRVFRIQIQEATLDIKKEELFARYKQGLAFETSPSLHHLMHGKMFYNIFETMEVTLFDGDELIATGFFDLGKDSAAGITSFYNPAYKKYSLGKYLIYLKMKYCKEQGLRFFYPGYFVPGYSFFNYKLEIGKDALEFFDVIREKWLPIAKYAQSPYMVMENRLWELHLLLTANNIESRFFNYEFFDANLFPELKDVELFDYPVFLYTFNFSEEPINPMIVFDVRKSTYRIIQCRSLWTSHLPPPAEKIYSYHLLAPEYELLVTQNAADLVEYLNMYIPPAQTF